MIRPVGSTLSVDSRAIEPVVDRRLGAAIAIGERHDRHTLLVGERDHKPRLRLRVVGVIERCPQVLGRDPLQLVQGVVIRPMILKIFVTAFYNPFRIG